MAENWGLEENVEDAIKAYLDANVTASMNIYLAWNDEKIKYPCAVVHAGNSGNIDHEGIGFIGPREVDVEIAVMVQAVEAGGQTARERNREARSAIITVLAQTALQDDLNALSPAGVIFSLAYIGDIVRAITEDKRVLTSVINLAVIASPETTTTTTTV